MIKPRKHLDLDISVLRISALILKELKSKRLVDFESVREKIKNKVGKDGELSFVPAISLLFLMGKVDYHLQNDSLEYLPAMGKPHAG